MTRSSTNELFTPYKEPEREFRSSRRHFKTLSLDESRSPDFNILSYEEYSEEEEEEEMAEKMEQCMSKTRTDYGSGSGAIPTKTAEDAKKAIQEMAKYSQKWHNETYRGISTETSDGLAAIQAQLNNLGREIKKVNEKVYAAQVGLKRHEENSNLIKEIRATTDAAIRNQGASIKTLEIQIGQMSKVLQERGFKSLSSSTETNPIDQVKSISTIIEADSHSIRRIGSSQYAVSTGQNSTLLYKSRQMTVPFPSRLDNHYYNGS
ncbi:hypothetical protein Tco_0757110 [Tanacetum coccineum]